MPLPSNLASFVRKERLSSEASKRKGMKMCNEFVCTLTQQINPLGFIKNKLTADDPWKIHAIPQKKNRKTDSWIVYAVLLHIHHGHVTEQSPIRLHITPQQIAITILADAASHRVAQFIESVDEVIGISYLTTDTKAIEQSITSPSM